MAGPLNPSAHTWGSSVATAGGQFQGFVLVDTAGNSYTATSAQTTGGASTYSFLPVAGTVHSAIVKASAGQVYGLQFFNKSASIWYGRLYNMATAPDQTSTANIAYRFLVPGNTSGAGFVVPMPVAMAFSTGIGIYVTGAIADNDTTVVTASVLLGNVLYK